MFVVHNYCGMRFVDREEEIEKFIPEEYWTLDANLKDTKSKKNVISKFYGINNGGNIMADANWPNNQEINFQRNLSKRYY